MKKIKFISLLLTLVLVFTACGPKTASNTTDDTDSSNTSTQTDTTQTDVQDSSATEAPSASDVVNNGEPAKLNIWIAGSGDAVYDKAYRKIFDAYCQKHTNISYELSFIAWGDYFTKLNTGLIGGAGPDIFMLGYGQMGSIQDLGYCLKLDDYIPADWDGYTDFYENILGMGKKDGSFYGLFAPSTRVFEYRKDIAEANGVTEDDLHIQSPEDFYNLVRKMTVKDASGKVTTYGLEFDPDGEQDFFVQACMYDKNMKLWNDDLTAAFNNEAAIKAMDGMKQLISEGVVCLRDPSATVLGVASGTAAMDLAPEANYAVANAAFPDNIGYVKNDMNTLLIGNFFTANAETKYPDAAASMLLDLYSKDSCQILAQDTGAYSGRKSLDAAYTEKNPVFENVVYSYPNSMPYSSVLDKVYTTSIVDFRTGVETMIRGADSAATLTDMETRWNAILNQ